VQIDDFSWWLLFHLLYLRKCKTLEQQYYIPSLEDFRPGFKCELRDPDYQGQSDGGEWKEMSSASNIIADTLLNWKYFQDYRVPYLTAEQIVAEGWIRQRSTNIFNMTINALCEYRLWFEPDTRTVTIDKCIMDDINDIYNGSCRCINDFRLICKLLNIK
jgi:hypothetical protein